MSRVITLADITASDAPLEINKKQFDTLRAVNKEKIRQLQENLKESIAKLEACETKKAGADEFIIKAKSEIALLKKENEALKGKKPTKIDIETTETANIDFDAIKKSGKELYEKKYKKEVDEYLRTLSL